MASSQPPNGSETMVVSDPAAYNDTPRAGQKRKRLAGRGPQSPDSEGHPSEQHHDSGHENHTPRHTSTKRACNECRQQKLRCDIVTEPQHVDCSRCRRLKLECRIDANFKRVGKRSRNAQMEKEIQELRAQLENRGSGLSAGVDAKVPNGMHTNMSTAEMLAAQQPPDPLTAMHQGAVGSLIELRNSTHGQRGTPDRPIRILGNTHLPSNVVEDLFKRYFDNYHSHIPVLDPSKNPDYYYECSPLLFWSVIAVASRRYIDDPTLLTGISNPLQTLIWTTIAQVPQNYHVVKALCLLCTWPLPTKSTSTDPTFILSGVMMQIALQTGLHRPSHVQDFSRIRLELREEDINDRLRTWAACNIVAQSVSTGNGQPPKTIYDYTLTHILEPNNEITPDLFWRLQIERFCNKVSQKLYNNRDHQIGISSDQERAAWISLLVGEYKRLERRILKRDSLILKLHLHAAGLHLRLSAFFDSPEAPNYANDLLELYFATTRFLTTAFEMTEQAPPATPVASVSTASPLFSSDGNAPDTPGNPPHFSPTATHGRNASISSVSFGQIKSLAALKHVGNYIMMMLLAAGFTLMKLLKSFFAQHIDADGARRLFNNTIRAIRAISVSNNDLPGRLAEVLAQLWRSSNAAPPRPAAVKIPLNNTDPANPGFMQADNTLQLRVRCRMSMSLLFDSVWRWREEFQFKNAQDHSTALANLENQTELDPSTSGYNSGSGSNAGDHKPNVTSSGAQDVASTNTNTAVPGFSAAVMQGMSGLDAVGLSNDPADTGPGAMSFAALGDTSGVGDLGYEVFDPLTWMLDGDLGEYTLDDSSGLGGLGGMGNGNGIGLGGGTALRDPWQ